MKILWTVFWATVAVFVIIIVSIFLISQLYEDSSPVFYSYIAWVIFFGLGIALLVLTVKKRVAGALQKFLLLTGATAVGFPVFVILHNLVTALFINFFGFSADFEEPVFFTLATLVCPIGFLVGVIGTIVITVKNKSRVPT